MLAAARSRAEEVGVVPIGSGGGAALRFLTSVIDARAVVEVGVNPKAVLVPQRGVSRDPRGLATALFVGADNKVEQRTIEVSQTRGSNWIVEKGVNDGDKIIVDGLQKVRAGATVKPVEVKPDAEQASAAPAPGMAATPKKN